MTIQTVADIVGADAKVALAAAGTTKKVRRIWLTAHGSSNARFGDTNVGAARGQELPADVQCTFSASDADIADDIDLTTAYVYVPTGTTVTVSLGL